MVCFERLCGSVLGERDFFPRLTAEMDTDACGFGVCGEVLVVGKQRTNGLGGGIKGGPCAAFSLLK